MQPDVADSIRPLIPRERVEEDPEPIVAIYRDLGSESATAVVQRALSDLGLALAVLADAMARRDLGDVRPALRRVDGMADSLGFVTLGLVCADLRRCLDQGEATAVAAVWARLCRVAEVALGIKACGHGDAR